MSGPKSFLTGLGVAPWGAYGGSEGSQDTTEMCPLGVMVLGA